MKEKVRIADVNDVCGISKIWALPKDHPFTNACVRHDVDFVQKKVTGNGSFAEVNRRFYRNMIRAADAEPAFLKRAWLKMQAVTYYNLANTVGFFYWRRK